MKTYIRLLKQRDFRLLMVADAVSVLGDQVGWVALLWFATVTTMNPAVVGLLGVAYGLPGVFLGPLVGTLLDRASHKAILVLANLMLGIVFTVIPLVCRGNSHTEAALLLLILIAGCLTPFMTTGWMVVMPNLVDDADLGSANALFETVWHGSSLVGPLVAGVLMARFGASWAVFADAISFYIAACCVVFLKRDRGERFQLSPNSPEQPIVSQHSGPFRGGTLACLRGDRSLRYEMDSAIRKTRTFLHDAWDGLRLLYRLKSVWFITLGALCLNVAYGQLEVSLPLLTHKELSGSGFVLGTLWTTYFLASLIGAMVSGILPQGNRSGIWMAFMVMAWGMSFMPMLWFHGLSETYVVLALAGCLFSGYPPLARTVVQRIVPIEYQGRVMGIRGSLMAVGMPAGSFLSGTLGNWMPSSFVMGYTGLGVAMFGLLLFSLRSFRTI